MANSAYGTGAGSSNLGLSNGWDCTRLVRNLHHVGRGRQICMQITRRPVSRPIIGHKPSVNGASRAPPPTGRVSHGGYSILINTSTNPKFEIHVMQKPRRVADTRRGAIISSITDQALRGGHRPDRSFPTARSDLLCPCDRKRQRPNRWGGAGRSGR